MEKRSVASANVSFGLVVFPVKFYLAAQAENVSMRMLTPAGNPVKQKLVDSVTGEEAQHADCSRGYELEKGRFVVFTKDELRSLEEQGSGCVEVREFVPASSLPTTQIEKAYHLEPGKGGDRAYSLFAQALSKAGRLAIAQWTTRGRQHLVAIAPAGDRALTCFQLYYADEVRPLEPACPRYAASDAESKMARKLLEAMSSPSFDASKYRDGYRDRVLAAVDAKAKGLAVEAPSAPKAPIADLLDALQASLREVAPKAPPPPTSKKRS